MIIFGLNLFYYSFPPKNGRKKAKDSTQFQSTSNNTRQQIYLSMGFVALLPFVDAIASLLLFDCNNQQAMPASSSLPPSVVPTLLTLPNSNSNCIVQSNTQRLLYRKQHDGISNIFTTSSLIGSSVNSLNDVWNLPNGRVQFDRPLSFAGIKFQDGTLKSDDSSTSSSISLWDPVFLGRYGLYHLYFLCTLFFIMLYIILFFIKCTHI